MPTTGKSYGLEINSLVDERRDPYRATQAACREHGCIYIQTVGGAAAWIAQCVRRVGRVWFEREFGATEAMWELAIEGLIGRVAIDTRGESLFTRVEQDSGTRLRALLAGKTEET